MGQMWDVMKEQREAAREAQRKSPKPRATVSERATGVSKYTDRPYNGPQWEYAVVNFVDKWTNLDDMRSQLDHMGAYGWEICERRDEGTGVTRQGGGFVTFVFKRRKM